MPQKLTSLPTDKRGTVREHLSGTNLFQRIDEMEYVDKLNEQDIVEFADQLLAIPKADITSHLKRAMTTSAGLISSFTTSRKSREYTRTWVLFQAILLSYKPQITSATWKDLDKAGKNLFRVESQSTLSGYCEELLTKIQKGFQEQRTAAENARKAVIYAKKQKAVRSIAKTRRRYRAAYVYAYEENKKIHSRLFVTNLKALLASKQTEINTNFTLSGIHFQDHAAPALTTLVNEFDTALKAATKTIDDRHNFKRNLAKNAFSAIKNYAPPPFNLIGVAGQAGILLGSKIKNAANAMYEDFGEFVTERANEETWAQADTEIKKLADVAVAKSQSYLTRAENWINGDAGTTKSDFDVDNFDIQKQFIKSKNSSYVTLINQLLSISVNGSLLRAGGAFSLESIMHHDVLNNNARGDLHSTAFYLQRTLDGGFNESKADKVKEMGARLEKIKLKVWNPTTDIDAIKRYYLLFMMGMYLDAEHTKKEGADASGVFVHVEKSFKKLLKKHFLVHSVKTSPDVKFDNGKISMPYSDRARWGVSNNQKDYVRFECLARIYATSDYSPISLLCGNTSTDEIETFLKYECRKMDRFLDTVSTDYSDLAKFSKEYPQDSRQRAAVSAQVRRIDPRMTAS